MPFNVDLTAYLQSLECKSQPASTNLQCNSDVFSDPKSYAVHASLHPWLSTLSPQPNKKSLGQALLLGQVKKLFIQAH